MNDDQSLSVVKWGNLNSQSFVAFIRLNGKRLTKRIIDEEFNLRVFIFDHPLIHTDLTKLRDKSTNSAEFRQTAKKYPP